jgi:outer membrane protein TolC
MSLVVSLVVFANETSCAQENTAEYTYIDFDTSVRLALENSYEILISKEEIAAAARQVENAARAYYPKVRLQGSARADLLDFEAFSSDDTTYGLILDWNPYQSGELLRRNAEAKLNFYIAKLNREQAVVDIVFGVQELYYGILKSQYALEAQQLSLDIERQKLEMQDAEFKAGKLKGADLLASRSSYYEKELALERERQAHGIRIIHLMNMVQRNDFDRLDDVERNIIGELSFTLDDCINTAYLRQRKYMIAKERENLARLGVKYAKLKRLPTLSFFTTSDYALDQSQAGKDFGFRVGLSTSYPLYDAGERKSIIDSAESYLRRSSLDLRKQKELTTLQVTEKYFTLQNQIELLNITREKEKRFADDWERARSDFDKGSITRIEYDKFKEAYYLSNNRMKDLELDVMLAQSDLLRAIGISSFNEIIQ